VRTEYFNFDAALPLAVKNVESGEADLSFRPRRNKVFSEVVAPLLNYKK